MKRKFTLYCRGLLILSFFSNNLNAQCGAGFTAAELNWDHLDYLPSNNADYTSFYPSAAFPYNQNFTIGTRRLNIQATPQANIVLNGENGLNTAHTASFASAGDDVQYTTTTNANTTVRLTFDVD